MPNKIHIWINLISCKALSDIILAKALYKRCIIIFGFFHFSFFPLLHPWWKSLKDLQGSLKISMRTFEDPSEDLDKDLYKIFKDLQGSSKFLPRSSRIFKVLTKIFKDLLFSCQDPQGSTKIFQFLAKIFKDLQRSSKFLPRSTRIFKVLAKIFKDL